MRQNQVVSGCLPHTLGPCRWELGVASAMYRGNSRLTSYRQRPAVGQSVCSSVPRCRRRADSGPPSAACRMDLVLREHSHCPAEDRADSEPDPRPTSARCRAVVGMLVGPSDSAIFSCRVTDCVCRHLSDMPSNIAIIVKFVILRSRLKAAPHWTSHAGCEFASLRVSSKLKNTPCVE